MALGGAPATYLAVNGGALAVSALLALSGKQSLSARATRIAMAVLAGLLALPLLLDPFSGEVHRWISLGPVSLHAAMLALPALLALAARSQRGWPLAIGFASAVAAVGPDRATASAALCAALAVGLCRRSPSTLAAALFAAAGLAIALLRPDTLAPVSFVEQVIADAWKTDRLLAPVLALALVGAIAMPVLRRGADAAAPAFSGCIGGFALAACLGAYPFPLIGYGASAILGYGLGLRFLR